MQTHHGDRGRAQLETTQWRCNRPISEVVSNPAAITPVYGSLGKESLKPDNTNAAEVNQQVVSCPSAQDSWQSHKALPEVLESSE